MTRVYILSEYFGNCTTEILEAKKTQQINNKNIIVCHLPTPCKRDI